MRVIVMALVGLIALAGCSSGGLASVFYVVIRPEEAVGFIDSITTIAKEEGFETATAQLVSDTGDVFRDMEGRGHGIKLWVQSAPLSGDEEPALCGVYHEPHSDPSQFIVSTERRLFGSEAEAIALGERLIKALQKQGFDVRRKPPICGAAALAHATT